MSLFGTDNNPQHVVNETTTSTAPSTFSTQVTAMLNYLAQPANLVGLFIVCAVVLAVNHVMDNDKVQNNDQTLTQLQHEVENDSGNAHDLNIPVESIVVVFLSLLILPSAGDMLGKIIGITVVQNALILATALLTPPVVLIALYGSFIANYVRGSSNQDSTAVTAALDWMSLSSFVARFAIQMIRYLMVMIKFKLVSTYLSSKVTNNTAYLATTTNTNTDGFLPTIAQAMLNLVTEALHLLLELIETSVLYFTQTGALIVVVVWLLSALYSFSSKHSLVTWYWKRK